MYSDILSYTHFINILLEVIWGIVIEKANIGWKKVETNLSDKHEKKSWHWVICAIHCKDYLKLVIMIAAGINIANYLF